MPNVAQKGVEDVLKDQGKLTADQYSLVKLEAINTGRAVEDILVEHRYATSDDVMQARSQLLGIPFIDLTGKQRERPEDHHCQVVGAHDKDYDLRNKLVNST